MKKIIFGIFAHPDDEAFGPTGTLLTETKAGAELHLITLTRGEAGANPDGVADLGAVRLSEWKKAGQLLGAKTMDCLEYRDGKLNNQDMIEIGKQIIAIVSSSLQTAPDDATIEFITLDLNGYTGHIDHIVAARAVCYAFYTLKKTDGRMSRVRLACLPEKVISRSNTDWIFMEAGRSSDEIDETVDARRLRDDIIAVMRCHRSQRADYETNLAQQGDDLGLNYFIVKD
jgi:LmbE family N-acetylglucosaminyl deacetylase